MTDQRILIAGAGAFGLSAAIDLARRGYAVEVLEAGEIPHPLAASTDISKVFRMEYGVDEVYMELAERAREGWLERNERLRRAGERPLYHETGVLMASMEALAPGGYEYESLRWLEARGHSPERLDGAALRSRFPAWGDCFVDGFFHAKGGWLESGRTLEVLAAEARRGGVTVRENHPVEGLLESNGRVTGVCAAGGRAFEADRVVLACGSWVHELVPELAPSLVRTYHPVLHLRPRDPSLFEAYRFPVFTADVAQTGFYGFPLNPGLGVVKVAHHGEAVEAPADGSLTVGAELIEGFREFLVRAIPPLADAEVVHTRLCPYSDTQDEDFWIGEDPERPGLVVASGGSGHAFKFVSVLGEVVADAAEGRAGALLDKFRWRPELRLEQGREAARCHQPYFAD